jgi:hypothetical protein
MLVHSGPCALATTVQAPQSKAGWHSGRGRARASSASAAIPPRPGSSLHARCKRAAPAASGGRRPSPARAALSLPPAAAHRAGPSDAPPRRHGGGVLLKTPWRDGTTALRFAPLTLLERLAALTPRPRINVLLYHGILAPHAAGRAAAVAYGRPRPGERLHEQASDESAALTPVSRPTVGAAVLEPNATPLGMTASVAPGTPIASTAGTLPQSPAALLPPEAAPVPQRPPRWRWADLLHRVFAVDVLACPRCGGQHLFRRPPRTGRLKFLSATVEVSVADAHAPPRGQEGLKQGLSTVLSGASWQRCRVALRAESARDGTARGARAGGRARPHHLCAARPRHHPGAGPQDSRRCCTRSGAP